MKNDFFNLVKTNLLIVLEMNIQDEITIKRNIIFWKYSIKFIMWMEKVFISKIDKERDKN